MLLLHALILAILAASFVGLIVNLLFFESLEPVPAPISHGRVSILVPARNEERSIAQCVGSLIGQDYPDFEVLVLDDSSSDRTGEIVRDLIGANPRHRLLAGTPLPEGWTGKNWACHQLAQAASGEWLLFTDADTVHSPGALSAALDMAVRKRADLLSAWPRLITISLGEKLVIPILHVVGLCWFPIAGMRFLQNHPRLAGLVPRRVMRASAGANGQFVLFRRSAYERIGGHAAVRDHIVDDVALGREIAVRFSEGMRLVNCDASKTIDCRMYRSFREVCEGFTKNARAAFEDGLLTFCLIGGLQFISFFLPFVLLFFPSQFRFALAEVAIIYLIRLILVLRLRTTWVGAALHPAGQFLAMAIGVRSWIATAGPGVEWKGRMYRPSTASRA